MGVGIVYPFNFNINDIKLINPRSVGPITGWELFEPDPARPK